MTGILCVSAGAFPSNAVPPVSVSISDQSISDSSLATATATYTISNGGTIKDHHSAVLETWLLGGGTNSNYEARATIVSGTLTSGTTGSWLGLGTTRAWSLSNGARNNSTLTTVLTIEIRLVSSGVVQDSATVTLSAESDNLN